MINIKNLTVRNKMLLLTGVFVAAFSIFAVFAYVTLDTVKVNGPLYQDIAIEQDVLKDSSSPSMYLLQLNYNCLRLETLMRRKDSALEKQPTADR